MKSTRYGISLVVFVSALAALVLRTHVPMTTAREALGITAVKGDAITARFKGNNRSHVTALARASQTQLLESYGKLPLSFEANQGQTNSQVQFLARGGGYTLFLTSTEAVLSLHGSEAGARPKPRLAEALQARHSLSRAARVKLGILPLKDGPALLRHGETRNLAQSQLPSSPEPGASAVLRMKLVGANPSSRVTGLNKLPGKSNYFLGKDRKKWRTSVPIYAKVKYDSVYPGVDLVYYGNQGQLEYDFVVGPGANPHDIALSIQGANGLNVDGQGDLVADISGEVVRFHKPVVYQPGSSPEIKNGELKIDGQYVLQGENQVGFEVAEYDTSKPLVIDPVLKYSTYLGGSGDDFVTFLDGIAVDPGGNAYIIGWTNSTDFPTVNPIQAGNAGGNDAFVVKLNSAGTALVYSTYLGGTGDDFGESIAVDHAGNAYVSGETFSTDFPTMNPIQAANAGGGDSFLAKLNPAGDALVYSTYLGGSDWDPFPMIEIDPRGNLYAEGATFSADFPTTAGAFQTTFGGGTCGTPPDTFPCPDIYVTKLNRQGSRLVYSTYLGGSGDDVCGSQIAVDPVGNVYVNGGTNSADFPTTPGAFQTALTPGTCGDPPDTFPCHDAFLTKLNRNGTGLVYSTYLGGSDFDFMLGTALDSIGNAYINGETFSSDFPTLNPLQAVYAGGGDAFVAKLNRHGTALIYSTYLGGTDFEQALGVAVDNGGNAYAVGTTYSTDFPITDDAFQTTLTPGSCGTPPDTFSCPDAFVTKLNRHGTHLVYSTYLGGSGDDEAGGIALDSRANVYIDGFTTSTDFPVVNAFQPTFGGGFSDAFVAKIGRGQEPEPEEDSAPAQNLTPGNAGRVRTNGAVPDWKKIILKRKAAH